MKPNNKLKSHTVGSTAKETEAQHERRMLSLDHRIEFVAMKIADLENRVCEEQNPGSMYVLYQEVTKNHNLINWLLQIKQTRTAAAQQRKQALKPEDAARLVDEPTPAPTMKIVTD